MNKTVNRVLQAIERKVYGATVEERAELMAAFIRRQVDKHVDEIFERALADDDDDDNTTTQEVSSHAPAAKQD